MKNTDKWESEFEELKGSLDEKIEKEQSTITEMRTSQAEHSDTSSEEYKKGMSTIKTAEKAKQKFERIKANSHKIENIMNYKKSLEKQVEVYKKELENRAVIARVSQLEEELNKEEEKFQIEDERIEKELKNTSLSDEEKAKLQAKRDENASTRAKRNEQYMEVQDAKAGTRYQDIETRDSKLKDVSDDDLNSKINFTLSSISKCNMIGKTLMEGKDWKEVEVKLENWKDRKLTSNKEFLERYKKETAPVKKTENKEQENTLNTENLGTGTFDIGIEENKEETAMTEKSKFEEKHPKLAKFFNKIKSGFKKIFKGKEEVATVPAEIAEIKDSDIEKIDFDKIAEEGNKAWDIIAEHGAENFLNSLKVERASELRNNEELMKKRQELKEKSAQEYANKYGGQYTKQDGQEEKSGEAR